jgi:hypothetical protein
LAAVSSAAGVRTVLDAMRAHPADKVVAESGCEVLELLVHTDSSPGAITEFHRWSAPEKKAARALAAKNWKVAVAAEAGVGLRRTVALYCRSSTLYHIR